MSDQEIQASTTSSTSGITLSSADRLQHRFPRALFFFLPSLPTTQRGLCGGESWDYKYSAGSKRIKSTVDVFFTRVFTEWNTDAQTFKARQRCS